MESRRRKRKRRIEIVEKENRKRKQIVELPVRSSVVLFGMVRYGPVPGKTVSVFQMNKETTSLQCGIS